ncbi:MAG: glycosyltransferase [Pirellulaceae bacterium]
MFNHNSPQLVSVVIPTYRGDRYIATALANVAAQTWTQWEVLVVEDGSHGDTQSIVRQFADLHPGHRVEYLSHPANRGQAAARNTAIEAARGTWIALLDVDDHWQPSHLAASLAVLNAEQASLAYSTTVMYDDETELMIGIWGPTKKDLENFPESLFRRSFIAPSAVVFHRELFDRVGGFETTLCPCEDLDYWIRCAAVGMKFAHVKGCHVLYRKNHSDAQTAGTCRLTESFARVLDRHQMTFQNASRDYSSLVARMYFSAAWCHAITSRHQDPTADPSRSRPLLWRAWELHRRKTKYWIHGTLLQCCERLQSNFLRRQFVRWFKPSTILRLGHLSPIS